MMLIYKLSKQYKISVELFVTNFQNKQGLGKAGSLQAGVVGEVSTEKEALEFHSCKWLGFEVMGMGEEPLSGGQIALTKMQP